MIHIVNPQTSEILDYITLDNIIDDTHKKSLESYIETYDAIVLGGDDFSYDKHLEKRNHIIIPDEDGTYQEFVLFEVDKYRDTEGRKTHFYAHATYLELKKAKIIYPTRREGFTLSQHAGWALNNTGWRVGIVESEGVRTFNIENHTNPYEFIKRIAREFDVEIRFRVEHDGRRITARYIDFLERIGDWKGREVEFGRDLDSIRRVEKQDIVTALLGLGPERDDGTRIEVLVEDEEALQRWGRVDEHGNLHHLIEPYEIQSERQEMTEEEARRYTRTALDKRINTQVTYETTILDLEEVPGLEHEKIRFGDTIRIKDTYFNPPLYLEARVFEIERSIKNKAKKDIKLGDYIEYTEEEVDAIWNQLRNEIRRRLDRIAIVSISSSAGNVFKNAQGETELTARTFVNGAERDEDGTLYDYQWMRFDKDGNHDTDFYAEGKTITVKASDIDEKATYRVLVAYELEVINTAEITISNVFDGEDGEPGPPGPKGDKGEDGKTFYTWIKYADTPTSGMSDSPEGKEYIGIAYNKESPTPSTNYSDYTWSKFKGDQGIPGPPGEDGQPTYTWVKYADDEHGNGMSDSPDGKLYIGLAFNKTTPQESNNPADYTWSLMPQNIEIGGRNYVIGNPEHNSVGSGYSKSFSVSKDLVNDFNTSEKKSFTMSCDIEINNATPHPSLPGTLRIGFEISLYDTNGTRHIFHCHYFPEQGETKKFRFTKTFNFDFEITEVRQSYIYTQVENGKVSKLKIELGHKATDWTPAPEDVQAEIDEAKQEAEEAKQEAQQAKTTADGKNTVFRQSSQPSTSGRKIGDVWFDTSRDNLMHVFNGTSWAQAKWGEQSIVANSITANHIKSLVGLNVNDQFIVDLNGNVSISNDKVTLSKDGIKVKDGDFMLEDNVSEMPYSIVAKANMVRDHSFELLLRDASTYDYRYHWYDIRMKHMYDNHWYFGGSPKVVFTQFGENPNAYPIFGWQAVAVRSGSYLKQSIPASRNVTYTLSAHFKRHWNTPVGGTPRLEVWRVDALGNRVVRLADGIFNPVPSDYSVVRHSITFTTPSDMDPLESVEIVIHGGNSIWVQCDGVQLVEGNRAGVYSPDDSTWEIIKGDYNVTPDNRDTILWNGASYPNGATTIRPDKHLSECTNGWVLLWSYWDGSAAGNYRFVQTHVHKSLAGPTGFPGSSTFFPIPLSTTGQIAVKTLYISNDKIVGHDDNMSTLNRAAVLRRIYEY